MYEEMTYEYLMERLLDNVPSDISTAEGSLIWSALSPLAYELEKAYIELDVILKQTFATTADYDYLELRARERGLTPIQATHCQSKGVFNVPVPEGSRFFIGDYNFVVGESLGLPDEYSYIMTCETAGTGANGVLGELTLIEIADEEFDIGSLTTMLLTEILIPARNKETHDEFLARYLESFDALAFGGNIKDYLEKVHSIEGVGGVQIYPAWAGGGTVKAVIVGNDYLPASGTLVAKVKEIMDPDDGLGEGLCPIGHSLTVTSATVKNITVKATLSYESGYDRDAVYDDVVAVVEKYFSGLRANWQSEYLTNKDGLVVRLAEVESRILNVKGVLDITNTTLNSTSGNVILVSEEVPILKEVVI